MLKILSTDTRVINIDQTWINNAQFLRRRWRERGQVNTIPEKKITPRVAMMLAIGTGGELYCSLTQVNTNSKVFCLFMSTLASRLSKEDKEWRNNTVILFDGAKYQTCKESQEHLKALGIKFCITAPYSFTTSPVEYGFAFLKSVDLNPRNLKTGKK